MVSVRSNALTAELKTRFVSVWRILPLRLGLLDVPHHQDPEARLSAEESESGSEGGGV